MKTDSNGNKQWDKTFGGTDCDRAESVQQTADGGYILAGGIDVFGGDGDFWIVKTDSNGKKEWDGSFKGTADDWIESAKQTSDGGYILTGRTRLRGDDDVWLVKTYSNGKKEWDKTFGKRTGTATPADTPATTTLQLLKSMHTSVMKRSMLR